MNKKKATKENQKALKIFQVDGTACLYLKLGNCACGEKRS